MLGGSSSIISRTFSSFIHCRWASPSFAFKTSGWCWVPYYKPNVNWRLCRRWSWPTSLCIPSRAPIPLTKLQNPSHVKSILANAFGPFSSWPECPWPPKDKLCSSDFFGRLLNSSSLSALLSTPGYHLWQTAKKVCSSSLYREPLLQRNCIVICIRLWYRICWLYRPAASIQRLNFYAMCRPHSVVICRKPLLLQSAKSLMLLGSLRNYVVGITSMGGADYECQQLCRSGHAFQFVRWQRTSNREHEPCITWSELLKTFKNVFSSLS